VLQHVVLDVTDVLGTHPVLGRGAHETLQQHSSSSSSSSVLSVLKKACSSSSSGSSSGRVQQQQQQQQCLAAWMRGAVEQAIPILVSEVNTPKVAQLHQCGRTNTTSLCIKRTLYQLRSFCCSCCCLIQQMTCLGGVTRPSDNHHASCAASSTGAFPALSGHCAANCTRCLVAPAHNSRRSELV
jgi:hypothetical protein